jgi:hypothetical protein
MRTTYRLVRASRSLECASHGENQEVYRLIAKEDLAKRVRSDSVLQVTALLEMCVIVLRGLPKVFYRNST